MKESRTKLGNKLFKLAKDVYPEGKDGNRAKKKLGNFLFKLAASVSPDKPEKAKLKVKEATVKLLKTKTTKK